MFQLANLREENQRLEMIHRQERNQLVNDMELQRELDKMNKERQFLKEEAKLKVKILWILNVFLMKFKKNICFFRPSIRKRIRRLQQ